MPTVSPVVDRQAVPVCGIYAIVNVVNGRRYVGSSNHVSKRWRDHIWELSEEKHLNALLQNAWNKHGRDAFTCELVEMVAEAELLRAEQRHIDANFGGYNLCPLAGKPPSGRRRGAKHSDETKRRLSARHKGKKLSAETRARMSRGQTERRISEGLKASAGQPVLFG